MGMAISVSWRWVVPVVAMVLLCVQISSAADPDKPAFTFHADADEVHLTFAATDQNDHGVATLRPADVVVIDRDIVVRQFQSFKRADFTWLQIAIVVDSSESVVPQFRRELSKIVELVSQTEGIPEENLSLVGFRDSGPSLICAGDCRTTRGVERLPVAGAGKLTPLFDSIMFATDFLAQRKDPHTKRILIILSDGIDTLSRNSLSDAIEAALRAGVEIDALDVRGSPEGVAALHRLTATTGGRYFPPQTGPTHAVNAILDAFRANYEITYRLPSRYPGFHSIRLAPSHNLNLQFRSRSGYYYPNETR